MTAGVEKIRIFRSVAGGVIRDRGPREAFPGVVLRRRARLRPQPGSDASRPTKAEHPLGRPGIRIFCGGGMRDADRHTRLDRMTHPTRPEPRHRRNRHIMALRWSSSKAVLYQCLAGFVTCNRKTRMNIYLEMSLSEGV